MRLVLGSIPQTYTVSDFIEWQAKHQLVLDPDFQRGSVWTPSAKAFLIDSILNELPIPQVYFRTKLNAETQTTVREIVDGQQRLRAILEFANNKFKLTSKSPAHKGKSYNDLDLEDKERFLSYRIPVVQLINADDSQVLEIFARLNSYSVKVTPAELRHAEFSEPVKWAIYEAARSWSSLWTDYKVVSTRDTVRLKNTSLIAEMFMVLENGLNDGGEPAITKYYKSKSKKEEGYFTSIRSNLDQIISDIIRNTGQNFSQTTFYDAPNFLILFAAVAFLKGLSPSSRATSDINHLKGTGVDWNKSVADLALIAQAVENKDDTGPYHSFVSASKSTLHRIAGRKTRLETVVRAMSNAIVP